MKPSAYPRYKPSGVEWLGEVPVHWEVKAARFGYSIQLGKMLQPEQGGETETEVPYLKSQHVQWETIRLDELPTMWASSTEEIKYGIKDGDLLVCEGGDVGRAGIVINPPPSTIIQNALHRVRSCQDNNLRFLMYVLEHASTQGWFEILCNRSTIAHFTGEKFGALRLPMPSTEEQQTIADFLDSQTAKIDTLLAKKRQFIEKLKEKRSALIARTVTRGLPPTAAKAAGLEPHPAMKDSGVEWLGEIPAHWETKRLRYIGEAIIGLTYAPEDVSDEEDGTLVLRSSNVQAGKITFDDTVYVKKAIPKHLRTRVGDILICSRNGSRALIGKNAMIDERSAGLTFGAFMTIFRSKFSTYLYWAFNSNLFEFQSGAFLTSTINQLTVNNLYGFAIALPPSNEQQAIAAYLDRETARIDQLTAKVEAAIARLTEYRQALITAAVTGKIDVRARTVG